MEQLEHLFAQNRAWSEDIRARDPEFFLKLSRQQTPDYLWIGCSDILHAGHGVAAANRLEVLHEIWAPAPERRRSRPGCPRE
jgi:hypothetical protein